MPTAAATTTTASDWPNARLAESFSRGCVLNACWKTTYRRPIAPPRTASTLPNNTAHRYSRRLSARRSSSQGTRRQSASQTAAPTMSSVAPRLTGSFQPGAGTPMIGASAACASAASRSAAPTASAPIDTSATRFVYRRRIPAWRAASPVAASSASRRRIKNQAGPYTITYDPGWPRPAQLDLAVADAAQAPNHDSLAPDNGRRCGGPVVGRSDEALHVAARSYEHAPRARVDRDRGDRACVGCRLCGRRRRRDHVDHDHERDLRGLAGLQTGRLELFLELRVGG